VLVKDDTMPFVYGIAWAPDGREVWFTGSLRGAGYDRALYALSLDGRRRLIARIPGAMTVWDVARDNRSALISTGASWIGMSAVVAGRNDEQPLDLLGRSYLVGLSADGKWLLANERREVGSGTYLRSTDGSPPIHLSDDFASGLSPDGAWALVHPRGDLTRLSLLSTGAGGRREVPLDPKIGIDPSVAAQWSSDGRRMFAVLGPVDGDDRSGRVYMRDGKGPWQAATPEGITGDFVVSPDGRTIAARDSTGVVALFPADGGPPRRLEGERGRPIHWSADGQLFLVGPEEFPARVYRRDLTTGRVQPFRDIVPSDLSGVVNVGPVWFASDDRTYVYQYARISSELYLAQGLR